MNRSWRQECILQRSIQDRIIRNSQGITSWNEHCITPSDMVIVLSDMLASVHVGRGVRRVRLSRFELISCTWDELSEHSFQARQARIQRSDVSSRVRPLSYSLVGFLSSQRRRWMRGRRWGGVWLGYIWSRRSHTIGRRRWREIVRSGWWEVRGLHGIVMRLWSGGHTTFQSIIVWSRD